MLVTPQRQAEADAIRRTATCLKDPNDAVRELAEGLCGPPSALRIVFASPAYDPEPLARALSKWFGDAPLIGCTTAGEIGPSGYLAGPGLSAASLPASDFQVEVVSYRGLRELSLPQLAQLSTDGLTRHRTRARGGRAFGLLLADGLAVREEVLVSSAHRALGGLPICGGSAGDGLDFRATRVLVDGRCETDSAALAIVSTARPFEVFKLQHFRASDTRLVVTGADPLRRIVHEIDGFNAAEAYAELAGIDVGGLTPQFFSTHPLVVRVGGQEYVRSIQRMEPDGSLVFYCAIDEGVVLGIANGESMAENLENEVLRIESAIGPAALTLGFDCVLRRLESQEKGLTARIDTSLSRLGVCGFATYGEQFNAMHVNQTLTGVAIGR